MGRLLAIDYGTKKIGIAVTDESQVVISSRPQIPNDNQMIKSIEEILSETSPEKIIIGYPSTDYDAKNAFQNQIMEFINRLKKITNTEIILQDESYSSEEAEKIFVERKGKSKTSFKKKKEKKNAIDSLAAHLLLKSYLNQNH